MTAEVNPLVTLVREILVQESAGNEQFFEDVLADRFAMRRADLVTFVDRVRFIAGVVKSPDRTSDDIDIVLQTRTLAVVRFTVATVKDGLPKRVSNTHVFVRAADQEPWKLLAWVNEPIELP